MNLALNDKIRERGKYHIHSNTIKLSKLKNKHFNTFKKIVKKIDVPLLSSKEKRNSVVVYKSENKKVVNNNYFPIQKPHINNYKNQESYNLILYHNIAHKLLRRKYNCTKRINNKLTLYKREEVSIYDLYQIQYLIENKKSRILCKLKEILILADKKEYLNNIYEPKESKIILRHLLFLVYDKDRMTYNKKMSEKINVDKIKLHLERINLILHKRYILIKNKYNNIENKEKSKDLFFDIHKSDRKESKKKYSNISELSFNEIHNCIPNLFPNDKSILIRLKEYLNKKLYQKFFKKGFIFKSMSEIFDTNKYNKSSKENNKTSKSRINKSFSKIIFNKKDNLFYNHNDFKRIKNDVDIYDVEKLIKKFERKDKKIKEKIFNLERKKDDKIIFHKIKKKLIFNFSNKEKFYEKNQLSLNSTTLTAKNRDNNISWSIIPSSNKTTKSINSYKKKIFINNYYLKKEGYNNNAKKLFQSSFGYNSDSFSFKNENVKESNQLPFQNNYIRNIFSSNFENKDEHRKLSKSFKSFINKENPKFFEEKKLKLINLNKFLELANENNFTPKKQSIKLLKTTKSFSYQNELYMFTKKKNENIWELGEDKNAQINAEYMKKRLSKTIKRLNKKSLNFFKKCTSLRKMANYGDIYRNDI